MIFHISPLMADFPAMLNGMSCLVRPAWHQAPALDDARVSSNDLGQLFGGVEKKCGTQKWMVAGNAKNDHR